METLKEICLADLVSWTISYLVMDQASRRCALIDSVLDYDPKSGRTRTESADRLIARVRELGGLCVSDEVQTGFGRTGDHFWGFQVTFWTSLNIIF